MIGVGAGQSIQAAINALPASGGLVKLGAGTHTIATALSIRSGVILEGEGSQATTVSYTGAAQALVQATPGTRIYGVGVRGIKFSNAGTGTIGLDLNSVSTGVFEDLIIDGFTTAVKLQGTNGYCVYNRFTNVTAANATTGYLMGAAGSNSNTFMSCRANVCTTGWNITDSNQNQLIGCQVEGGTTGVSITSTSASLADRNTIAFTRFEGNTTNVNITSSNVRETALLANHHVNGTNVDSGTRTMALDTFGATGLPMTVNSVRPSSMTGNFRFTRSANAHLNGDTGDATPTPAFVVADTNTATGNPITHQVETERATGSFYRGVRGGNPYFEAFASGALGIRDGISAPAAVTGLALLYVDTADGDLKVRFSDGTIKTIVVDT
jgi:hypothetical protein